MMTAAIAIGGMGLVCGGALALAARYLAVHEDPRIEKVGDILPGANCGGCGFAGCADYARAIVVEDAAINLCAPGGQAVLDQLAHFMGKDATAGERNVALVLCRGDQERAPRKYEYNGVADCAAVHAVAGGDKRCAYGCLGYGSCVRACPVGAIELKKGLAVVHPDLCIGCGACVRTCPRMLIQMVPAARHLHVMCSSHDKGPAVKKACSVGCIGCSICVKMTAGDDAPISMDNFLAVVDYTKPIEQCAIVEKCPGKCIVDSFANTDAPPLVVQEQPATGRGDS